MAGGCDHPRRAPPRPTWPPVRPPAGHQGGTGWRLCARARAAAARWYAAVGLLLATKVRGHCRGSCGGGVWRRRCSPPVTPPAVLRAAADPTTATSMATSGGGVAAVAVETSGNPSVVVTGAALLAATDRVAAGGCG